MSGIAAIIRFDGGAIEPGQIERMTAAMAYRGVDGIAHWRRRGVALGHGMLRTTAESLEEVQPLANEDESLVLVMDGWLSNWQELRADLLARGARLRDRSDAELVLRAYEVWGEDCPRHIDGEFAFLIWDARRSEAFCARDHAGLRPLHYHWDGKRLIVASDIAGVLAGPGVEARRNRGMIAEYLANDWLSRDETIWLDVMRLKSAHWLRFSQAGMRGGEYWLPPFEPAIHYKRDEDYFAHYRELFADCVLRASRTHLPLSCDVSGGLDSSAIFCMAHELQRAGKLPAPGIEGYSYRFEGNAEADEIGYARAVARHVGAQLNEVDPFLPELSWFVERGREYRDVAGYPNGTMGIAIGERLVANGSRVLLNGEGGDEFLAGKPFYFQEMLAARDWGEILRTLREDASAMGARRTAWNFLRYGLAPLVPEPLLKLRRKLQSQRGVNRFSRAFWLSPELEELLFQRRTSSDTQGFMRISNRARRSMYMVLTYVFVGIVRDHIARQSARIGYEVRSPMYAKSFVEFAFAIPERMRLRGGVRKYIHIKALAGTIPDAIARRTTKAGFSIAFTRHLDHIYPLLADALAGDILIDLCPEGVTRLYDRYYRGSRNVRVDWELWGIFAVASLSAGEIRAGQPRNRRSL